MKLSVSDKKGAVVSKGADGFDLNLGEASRKIEAREATIVLADAALTDTGLVLAVGEKCLAYEIQVIRAQAAAGKNGNITTIGETSGAGKDVDLIANNTDLDVEALGSVVGFTQAAAKPAAGLAAEVEVFLHHVNGAQGAANAQVKVSLLVESVA